jgi:DNA-binding response OmpR family regulator
MGKGLGFMRLLLLEDEVDLAIAIQKTLRSQHYVVDWARDGKLAWESLQMGDLYQMAILDWMVPGLSGLEICQRLRQQEQPIPVLMLTARDRMDDRVAGLDAGADDYLVKPFGMEELLARTRALLRRPSQMQTSALSLAGLTLNYQTFSVVQSHERNSNLVIEQSLTAKEFQLLEYFMQHPNQILSQDQIRSRLWGFEDDAISNIVAAQVRLLRRKLEALGDYDRIETLRGLGYRFNA